MGDIEKILEEAWHQDALAGLLPFESWERLSGESGMAYAAFCAYRDMGPCRNIRKAAEQENGGKHYRVWRGWSMRYKWRERAEAYDSYVDKLRLIEQRKTIEAQGEVIRAVAGKMAEVAAKKLDTMDPAELTQGSLNEWVNTASRVHRETAEQIIGKVVDTGRAGQMTFGPEFEGV